MLASALCWGIGTVLFTRLMNRGLRPGDAALLKNVIATGIIGAVALLTPHAWGGGASPANEFTWLLTSGVVGLGLGDLLYFLALAHIGVARTLLICLLVVPFNALLAWLFLGETLGLAEVGLILVTVSGVALVEGGQVERGRADLVGVLGALGSAVCWAFGNLMTQPGLVTTGPVTGAAGRLAGGLLFLLAWRAFRWSPKTGPRLRAGLRHRDLWLAAMLGTVLGMTFYAGGIKWAKQAIATALACTTPVFAMPLAVRMLGERPGWRGWLGAACSLTGAVSLVLIAA